MSSSSSSTQGNLPSQSLSPKPSSRKRTHSQLEGTGKVRRRLRSITDVSSALQSVQHSDPLPSETFSSPYSWSAQQHFSDDCLLPPQAFTTVEQALQTLRMRRLDDYKQAVYIPPSAKPSLQASHDTLSPLMERVQDFLSGDGQVMLILGDSGSGKSTFNRHLEHQLWKNYKPGGAIPLFINLPALDRPEKYLIVEHLGTFDFSEKQIQELRQHRRFVLICDGYDESQLSCNLHTTNLFNQSGQWSAKLVITCRTQYLGKDYSDLFVPMAPAQYFRPATDLFQEAVLAPFTRGQIEDYVERYVPPEPRTWVKKDYMDKLIVIPGLLGLVKNPFLLTLCLHALPSVVEGKSDLFRLRVTRVQLYDHFVMHWLGVNKRRLQDQKLSREDRQTFGELKDDGFEQRAIDFQRKLAAAIFIHQDGRPIVDYTPRNDKNSWKAAFFDPDPCTTLLRGASLLSRMGNQHRFVHRSVLEYFYSCTVCPPPATDNEFGLQGSPESASAPLSISDHPLSRRSLVAEPSIVQFLAQRAQMNPDFKRQLYALLEQSKADEQASQAAANAITILVKADVRFNGADLQSIRVPGADLSGGQFDSAQFQGAILTDVNLSKSWIRQADFSNARMGKVQFGELPYLVESRNVYACAFSPDGISFAVGIDSGDINIYETATWTRTRVVRGHQSRITSLAYSSCSHRLLSVSKDETVRLWNCSTWLYDIILKEYTAHFTAIAFSPSGRQVALACDDKYLRLWDAGTGSVIAVIEHDDKFRGLWGAGIRGLYGGLDYDKIVTRIAYSPDGRTIISANHHGTIQAFDTQTGTRRLTLKRGREPVNSKLGGICCIACSPDGQWIVSGTESGTLQLWEVNSGTLSISWKGHDGAVSSVTFSPNGQWIASASQDRLVKLWNPQAGTLVSALTGHMRPVAHVAFSNSGTQLASCGLDMTVRLWEVNSIITGPDYHGTLGSVTSVAYSPDGKYFVYGGNDGSIRRYDGVANQSSLVLPPGSSQGGGIVFSTDGLRVATFERGGNVRVWSVETEQDGFVLRNHERVVRIEASQLHGDWIATGRKNNKTVQVQPVRLKRVRSTDPIKKLLFSLEGHHVVTCFVDGSAGYRDVNNNDPPRQLSWEVSVSCCWLPNTPLTATTHGDSRIILRNDQTGELQILIHDRNVHTFGVSSCGQWIAAGCENYVHLWRSSLDDKSHKWKRVGTAPNFYESVKAIVWRPQALEFVVSCVDGSARAWRLREELGGVSVVLVWSIGVTGFEASGAMIADTVGLGEINRKLLKQYGAIAGSSSSPGLENQGRPDVLVQADPLEAANLSDSEKWQWEEVEDDYEDEEDQESKDEEEEENVQDDEEEED